MARHSNQGWQDWESEYKAPETLAECEAEEAYVNAEGPSPEFTEDHGAECSCGWCHS